MNGIWKKTLKRFVPDFIGFAKDERVVKINKAVFEMANTLTWVWVRMTLRSSDRWFLRN